ncbi:hypothetical protein [Enterococcus larvae]|uniref:hypothetical protein n=1 Tax=Enterococcus larvae TaxID=2794352 RepID=UPI003F3F9DA6
MNKYDEKAMRMYQHLKRHPADYQTVVSAFKAESDSIAFEHHRKRSKKKAAAAKYMKG